MKLRGMTAFGPNQVVQTIDDIGNSYTLTPSTSSKGQSSLDLPRLGTGGDLEIAQHLKSSGVSCLLCR